MKEATDVLVIGGGPAGLAAAIAARMKGFEVTVVDGTKPPIDKACGEGLMPDGLAALRRIGVGLGREHGASFRGSGHITAQRPATQRSLARDRFLNVMAGLVPATPIMMERPCDGDRGRRDKPGDDCGWGRELSDAPLRRVATAPADRATLRPRSRRMPRRPGRSTGDDARSARAR